MSRQAHLAHLRRSLTDTISAKNRAYTTTYPRGRGLPHEAVRGLVRGLLLYFSMPARRSGAEQIHLDRLEMCLLRWIEEQANPHMASRTRKPHTYTRTYTNDAVNRIADSVPETVKTLLRHPSPLVLTHESEWLRQELVEYAALPKDFKKRLTWVQKRWPRLSYGLLRVSRCPRRDCPRGDTVPDRDALAMWLEDDGLGPRALTFHILAHYHNSTYNTIKRSLQSHAPRIPRASR